MAKDPKGKSDASAKTGKATEQDPLFQETMDNILKQNQPQSKAQKVNQQQTATLNQQATSSTSSDDPKYLYEKLQKKYGINEDQQKGSKKSASSSSLETQSQGQASQITRPKAQIHITEARAQQMPPSADPFMESSHLDKRNEPQPEIYKYLDGFREFRPQINIGQRWGHAIQQHTVKNIEYEQSLVKGKGFLWKSIKMGKLGVDLFFIGVGITGIFIIPFLLYQRNEVNKQQWIKSRGITRETVPDYEEAGYDLDDVSREENLYNMFQKEIIEEKQKKLVLHNEIQSLMNMLFPNK